MRGGRKHLSIALSSAPPLRKHLREYDMTIKYVDMFTFYAGIRELVEYGLTFEADADSMTITLTGGY